MSFWIYNQGLGIPISEKSLLVERKTLPLSELTNTSKIHSTEDEAHHKPIHETILKSELPAISTQSQKQKLFNSEYQSENKKRRQLVFVAEQIMSSPVFSLSAEQTVESARQFFVEKGFRHFPVVGENKRLAGILADRDLLNLMAARGHSADDASVDSIMKRHVLTALVSTDIREICRVMFSRHIGALPILNEDRALAGIITRSDILRTMIEHGPFELWA